MSKDKIDTILYFIFKIVMALIGVVTLSLYTKLINPDEFGKYSLILGAINLIIAVFIGWIGSAALRYYDEYKKNKLPFFSTVLIGWGLMLVVAIGLLYLFGNLTKEIPILEYYIYIILLTLSLSFISIFEKIIRASRETYFYIIVILLQNIVNLVVFYLLVNTQNKSAEVILLANIISQYLVIVLIFFKLNLIKNLSIKKFSKEINRKFLYYGFPMIGVWGISWILSYSDRFLIKIYYTYYEVGIYDIAYKISEQSIGVISSAFILSVFPILITTWNSKGKEGIESKFKVIWKYYLMLLLPACVGLSAISETLYGIVIDNKYNEGSYIIKVASLGFLFMGINDLLYKIWQLKEKTKNILIMMLISVISNIGLNILLLPIYGYQVAIWTTFIAYFISTVLTIFLVRNEIKLKIEFHNVLKIFISLIVMYVFLKLSLEFITSLLSLLIIIVCAVIIYFTVLFIIGGLKEEKKSINNFLKKLRHK